MKPNVLCVGFAKCGTTTLYDIMKQHPDIYLSGIKEPIYYGCKDLVEERGFEWYQNRYYPKSTQKKVVMEINPVIGKYVAPSEIKKNYGKNVKIIFMIRNPIKRLYSNFTMNLVKGDCFKNINDNLGNENLLFDKWIIDNFLDEKGNIISNDIIPKFCKSGNYFNVIRKYIDLFGKNNVKVIIFEDFISNMEKECKDIFDFIGVKNNKNINFSIFSNEGNRIPFNKLSIKSTKIAFKIWENIIIKRFKYISYSFSNFWNNSIWNITKIFSKKTTKKEISYCSRIILNNYYKEMCIKLGELLNIDLVKKWNIDVNDICKEDKIVMIIKRKFQDDLLKIHKYYYNCAKKYNVRKLRYIIQFHRDITVKIIKEVITFFPELNNSQFIALNGSFASESNIFDSDVDLNIFHKNDNIDYLLIELKISYILARVMDFKGVDRIHSIMVYTDLTKNIKYKIYDSKIIFKNFKSCPLYFRENFEQLLFETINTSRDYNKLLEYFDRKIKKDEYINNWLNNFLLVKDYGEFDIFKKELEKNINKIKQTYNKNILNKNILKMINKLEVLYNYKPKEKENISVLKKYHKTEFVEILKNTIFILEFIDIRINKKKKMIQKVYSILYKQLFAIMRLKMILKEYNMDLSSHSTNKIKIVDLERKSKILFGVKNIFKKEKKYIKKTKKILESLVIMNV